MKPYRLAPGVYLAVAEEGAVFLNLQKGGYVGFDAEQVQALSSVVQAWPAGRISRNAAAPAHEEALSFAQDLCERGLLVPASAAAIHEPQQPLPSAEEELIAWEHMSGCRVRAVHVLGFLVSFVQAAFLLKLWRFSRVVARVQARKARRHSQAPFPRQTVRELLGEYFFIRAFVFGAKGRCLLDSLTLVEFLARYDVYPSWVIAVQVKPFAAHSWLQHEACVLNGTPSYVRAYAPILVV